MHVCFCCVCYSFSVVSQEIGWEERLQNVPSRTLTQSVYHIVPFLIPESELQGYSDLASLSRCGDGNTKMWWLGDQISLQSVKKSAAVTSEWFSIDLGNFRKVNHLMEKQK